jgi:hypothetical protein
MSLPVKDGGGNNVILVSTLIGGEHAVHHVMMGSSDGGTTMRVLNTLTDGTVVISGAVTVTGGATEATLLTAQTNLLNIESSLADITRAEDAVHASGSRGVVALSVRRDTPTPTAADGDYTAFISGPNGGLWVETIGGATEANQDTTNTSLGATNETPAANDTAVSGLNGLVKRLLARISTLIGGLPAALGQTNSAGSFPVVIANNQSAIAVTGTFFQGTQPVSLASLPALAAGTAGIGKLTANSGVIIGAVEITAAQTLATVTTVGTVTSLTQFNGQTIALNAGAASAGTLRVVTATDAGIIARFDSASLYNGSTAMTPKFAAIACGASGDNTIIAAVSAKKIRVLAFRLKAATASSAAVACYWRNGAAGSALEGGASNTTPLDKTGAAGAGGETAQFNPVGWFETSSNTALVLNLSAAQAVTGSITYVEV